MRESLHKTGDDAVVQVGYVANIPYFLCHGLETLGCLAITSYLDLYYDQNMQEFSTDRYIMEIRSK